ncbi:MAG: hypothetical protein IT292_08035 [Deltaproteobacteria bacterium]|nr:hypothetical protein [Deltaproteobacteria bacterium]
MSNLSKVKTTKMRLESMKVYFGPSVVMAVLGVLILIGAHWNMSVSDRIAKSSLALKNSDYSLYWALLDRSYFDGVKQPEMAFYYIVKGVQRFQEGKRNLGLHFLGEASGFDPNFTGARIASDIVARNLSDEELVAAMLKEVNELNRPEAKWLLDQKQLAEQP